MTMLKYLIQISRFLPVIILIPALIGLAIRLIPLNIVFGSYPRLEGLCDSWFLLTQVETIIHNYPTFSWFYPAIGFPQGLVTVEMNPLLPLVASTTLLLSNGAGNEANISIISFIPIICYLLLIPILYYFGSMVYGRGAGIIAASLVCIVPTLLSRTVLGYLDHHCFEILFSAGFCYFFIRLIPAFIPNNCQVGVKPSAPSMRDIVIAALPSAILFCLGILNVITMMVFFVIVLIILTLISFIDYEHGFDSKRVLISYCTIFIPSALILILLGIFSQSQVVLQTFTLLAMALVFGGVWLKCVYFFQKTIKKYHWNILFPICLFIFAGFLVILLKVLIPQSWDLITYFFAYPYTLNLEWTPLSVEGFLIIYGVSIIPVLTGVLICIQQTINKRSVQSLFLLVWFGFFLIASFQHQRHLYYLDLPWVILAGIGLYAIWARGGTFVNNYLIDETDNPSPSQQEENEHQRSSENSITSDLEYHHINMDWLGKILAIALFLGIIFQFSHTSYSIVEDDWSNGVLNTDFIDAMKWLREETHEPVIAPFQIYRPEQYNVPPDAYSVITPWVYGYAAHYWSKLPVSTNGNKEMNGAVVESLYGSRNLSYSDDVMRSLHGRYLIISSDFLNDEFPMYIMRGSQIPPITSIDDYISFIPHKTSSESASLYPEYYEPFYETLAIHLYLLDGNYYPGLFNGTTGSMGSESLVIPPYELEALDHFRLVYESKGLVSPHIGPVQDSLKLLHTDSLSNIEKKRDKISQVKIFEYVNGTEIAGEGVIEIPVTTNQGRTFMYRQKSQNGKFNIPYDISEALTTMRNIYEERRNIPVD